MAAVGGSSTGEFGHEALNRAPRHRANCLAVGGLWLRNVPATVARGDIPPYMNPVERGRECSFRAETIPIGVLARQRQEHHWDRLFMSGLLSSRLISCDEAGFTGNNLLNPDQPFFSYASHDLTLVDAESLVRRV